MTFNDGNLAKLQERNQAMRTARDEMLRRVASWLIESNFTRVSSGHFTRAAGDWLCHVGFQKLRTGRDVRVMCHVTDTAGNSFNGPWSDAYQRPNSPNGQKYWFAWSTREPDIARCAEEYCRYIRDVVFEWFQER